MRLIVYGLMIVFLTACGEKVPSDVAAIDVAPDTEKSFSSKTPVHKEQYAKDDDFIVRTGTVPTRVFSVEEKATAKAEAVGLLSTMKTAENLVTRDDVMQDTFKFYHEFSNPLMNRIKVWPNMLDDRRDPFDDLNYCQSAALMLHAWGDGINNKKIPDENLLQYQDKYLNELPKCERAIKNYK